jgi:hypothetical protein
MPSGLSRILTSHAGSLPRPEDLIKLNHQRAAAHFATAGGRATPGFAAGAAPDEQEYQRKLSAAVTEVVARQQQAGVDLVKRRRVRPFDGAPLRLRPVVDLRIPAPRRPRDGPAEPDQAPRVRPKEPGDVVLSTFPERRDWVQFAEAYGDPTSGVALLTGRTGRPSRSAGARSATAARRRSGAPSPASRPRWAPPGSPRVPERGGGKPAAHDSPTSFTSLTKNCCTPARMPCARSTRRSSTRALSCRSTIRRSPRTGIRSIRRPRSRPTSASR